MKGRMRKKNCDQKIYEIEYKDIGKERMARGY